MQFNNANATLQRIRDRFWVTLIPQGVSDPEPINEIALSLRDTESSKYPTLPYHGFDWTVQADWYRRDTHWRAWIPRLKPSGSFSIYNVNRGNPALKNGRYVLPSAWTEFASKQSISMSEVLHQWESRRRKGSRYPKVLPLPPRITPDRFTASYDTAKAAETALVALIHEFCETCGALKWASAWDPEWHANVGYVAKDLRRAEEEILTQMEGWWRGGGRGVVLDIERDWREMNISLYLENKIPVIYEWTESLWRDQRFASLSPGCLKAIPCPEPLLLPGWATVWFTPITDHSEDQFLQIRHPYSTPVVSFKGSTQGLGQMQVSVIDFEDWKPRPVNKKDASRYFIELWFEELVVEMRGSKSLVRRQHRCRPRFNTWNTYNYLNAPCEESLHELRECFKFICCPPPLTRYVGPRYDAPEAKTGLTIDPGLPLITMPRPPQGPVSYDDSDSEAEDPKDFAPGRSADLPGKMLFQTARHAAIPPRAAPPAPPSPPADATPSKPQSPHPHSLAAQVSGSAITPGSPPAKMGMEIDVDPRDHGNEKSPVSHTV